jgi:hypothetical protein
MMRMAHGKPCPFWAQSLCSESDAEPALEQSCDCLPFATVQHADAPDLIAPLERRHARNVDHARLAQAGGAEIRGLDVVLAQGRIGAGPAYGARW